MFSSSVGLPVRSGERSVRRSRSAEPPRPTEHPLVFVMLKAIKILFGLLVLCVVAAGGLAYFFRDKITDAVQVRIKADLADEGIFADWRLEPIALGPDLVVKARDIKTFRDSSRKVTGAELSNLDIHVHLLPTLTGKKLQAAFVIQDATLTLSDLQPKSAGEAGKGEKPAERPEEPVSLTGCNLNAELTATQWRVASSSLLFQGVRFSLSGVSDLPRKAGGPRKPLIRTVEVEDPGAAAEPSSLDFSALLPVARALDYRKAGFKPEIKISYSAALDRDAAWNIDVKAETISFPSRDRNLTITTQSLIRHDASGEIRSLVIKEGEAMAEGNATIDKGAESLNVSSITSNLDWVGLLRDFPMVGRSLDSYRITSNPSAELAGVWSFVKPKESAMSGSIRGLHGTYEPPLAPGAQREPGFVPLALKDAEAAVQISGGSFEFKDGFATLAEGPIRFELRFQPFDAGVLPWNLGLVGENLALAPLTSVFAGTPVEGTANLRFEGSGDLKPKALNGQGGAQITASKVLKMPLVSPLLDLLSTLNPSLGKADSERLDASFTIKDGVVTTDDLKVALPALQVNASGTIDLQTEETKFQANASLRGGLQRLIPGLPEALAIEGGGPLKKVHWSFKNFQAANPLIDRLRGGAQPPGGPTVPAPPANPPGPGPQTVLPAKAEDLLRTVDQIGGMIKGLKAEPKPAPQPPAP